MGIPTYNNPDGLRKVLACITAQSYQNLEIIVSDNCSTHPEILEIANGFRDIDPRIKVYRQSENIGADNNFIFVKERATGKYFMWAQDDDGWSRRFIENLVGGLEQNPEIPLACCPSQFITPDGRKSEVRYLDHLSVYNAVGNGDLGLACNGIWKRDEMIQIEFPRNLVLGIDHILPAIVLMKHGKIVVVNSERYIKGLTPGKFEDCFNQDFWYSFRSLWFMVKVLAESPTIPKEKKLVLPFIIITNFVRALGITGIQMIIAMPNNPIKSMVQRKFFGAN